MTTFGQAVVQHRSSLNCFYFFQIILTLSNISNFMPETLKPKAKNIDIFGGQNHSD